MQKKKTNSAGDKKMKINEVHCLFEQSGTFKDAFRKLGYTAYDYDFIETEYVDYKLNILDDIINKNVGLESTIMNNVKEDDLIIAFFPCTYFSDQSMINSRGDSYGMVKWDLEKKLYNSISLMSSREHYYKCLCLLCIMAIEKKTKLIIENPDGKCNFLKQFFPVKNKIVIKDRRVYGDVFKKRTQFFFINCEPEFHLINEVAINEKETKVIEKEHGFERSKITPAFAENFIKAFILD